MFCFLCTPSHGLDPCYAQEDPYKLTLLAKDLKRIATASVDFFFTNEDLCIVSTDDEGILRVYEYNPQGETGLMFVLVFVLTRQRS